MARILICFFCVFALNTNRATAYWVTANNDVTPPAPFPPTTPGTAWETRNLGGLMFSVMPNAVVSFRSVTLSNVTGLTLCLRAVTEQKWLMEDGLSLTFDKNVAVNIGDFNTAYEYKLQFNRFSMVLAQGVRSLWKSSCLTWDSSSGMAQLWFDGKMSARKGLSRGTVFSGQPELTMYQFEGQVSDVYLWDSVLSVRELHRYLYHHSVPSRGSILDWKQMEFRSSGYVVLEPAYPKRLPAGAAKRKKQKMMKALRKWQKQEV
ncbi:serum amyloid P-component-like isoform X2 [Pangasianodon hypophthalmus]|uniref:serum amyloid P-component-like isoform X2 n=1 Tax=Pangasianodon hypophthalmus TaxID=310915 RepID=UPI0023074157|nr:serum amyloid P-component-like isoform X2 [Pangasianodon hypophthalmus]